jgi:hypothetical protein
LDIQRKGSQRRINTSILFLETLHTSDPLQVFNTLAHKVRHVTYPCQDLGISVTVDKLGELFVDTLDVRNLRLVLIQDVQFECELCRLSVVPEIKVRFQLLSFLFKLLDDLGEALINILNLLLTKAVDIVSHVSDVALVILVDLFGVDDKLLKVGDVFAHNTCNIFQLSQLVAIVLREHALGAD